MDFYLSLLIFFTFPLGNRIWNRLRPFLVPIYLLFAHFALPVARRVLGQQAVTSLLYYP